MKMSKIVTGIALACLALAYGCGGEPPLGEMDAANQALQDARSAGAEKFASNQLNSAQQANDDAKSQLTTESDKLFKDFEPVKAAIADAKTKADRAKNDAMEAKSTAKSAADAVIGDAAAVVQQAQSALDNAPAGKGTEADIEALRTELGTADADLSAARAAVASEDFSGAEAKAAAAKQKAEEVAGGVEMAVQKYHELVEKMRPWYEKM